MICSSCGAMAPDTASFCTNCGASLKTAPEPQVEAEPTYEVPEAVAQPEPEPAPVVEPQPEPEPAAAPASDPEPIYEVPGADPQPQPQPQAAPAPDQPFAGAPFAAAGAGVQQPGAQASAQPSAQKPAYAKGCVAAALDDVKATKGWLGKAFFLGLVACVPILNFVIAGYLFNWSREVPYGRKTPMPERVITGPNFEMGFYLTLIMLVFSLVGGVVAAAVELIPFVGMLLGLVVVYAVSAFSYLCQMRATMMQQLGEGFKILDAWNVLQRNWTSLLCAALVPALVATVILLVVSSVLALIITLVASGAVVFAVGGMGVGSAVFIIIAVFVVFAIYVACCMATAGAELVTARALGHWVARYAPEWAEQGASCQ